jgi:hypothetical protein
MNVSNLRKAWREFKQAFDQHLAPALGPKWTKKAFGLGLGPKLDELAKEYELTVAAWDKASGFIDAAKKGDLTATNEVQAKMGSVQKHAEKVDKLAGEALAKLNAYQDTLQQGMNEALRKGSFSPQVTESFKKAFGSLNVMRELVSHCRDRAINYYGRNAKFWQGEYQKLLKKR